MEQLTEDNAPVPFAGYSLGPLTPIYDYTGALITQAVATARHGGYEGSKVWTRSFRRGDWMPWRVVDPTPNLADAAVAVEAQRPVAWLRETTPGGGVWHRSVTLDEPPSGFVSVDRKTPLFAASQITEANSQWRDLALKFDAQRMVFRDVLKMVAGKLAAVAGAGDDEANKMLDMAKDALASSPGDCLKARTHKEAA